MKKFSNSRKRNRVMMIVAVAVDADNKHHQEEERPMLACHLMSAQLGRERKGILESHFGEKLGR